MSNLFRFAMKFGPRLSILGAAVALAAGFAVCEEMTARAMDSRPSGSSDSSAASQLFDLLNQERIQQNLPALAPDEHLAEAARKHSQTMVQEHKLAHQLPGEGVLTQRLAAAHVHFEAVAENVAYSGSVDDAHVEFMHSPGHRANILSADYNAVGIGIAQAGNGRLYITEDFAHRVPEYSPDGVEKVILDEMNHLRAQHRIPPLQLMHVPMLRHEACRDEVNAHSLGYTLSSVGWVVVFTGADPAELPSDMKKVSLNRESVSVALGACFPTDTPGGYAMYKVVAVFFRK
jgi:uncharacterized protein YkwD